MTQRLHYARLLQNSVGNGLCQGELLTSFANVACLTVCRLLKETGRLSNSPVFVVGIYSGADKLGEGFGSSLRMAEYRVRTDYLDCVSTQLIHELYRRRKIHFCVST